MKKNKIIVANWKMNIPPLDSWKHFSSPKNIEAVICPPFPYLGEAKEVIGRSAKLGAQDMFWKEKGAFTGEVSPVMLLNSGVSHVIIGHSERRRWLGETDEMINKKALAALKAGLKVILCVGEPLAVRKRGINAAKKFVANQLSKDLQGIRNWKLEIGNLIVAYEPIWAVGTGKPDNPADSAKMAKYIKAVLLSSFSIPNSRVLYGGSVTNKNAKRFFEQREIDGALVGGASLNQKEFSKIAATASQT